MVNRIYSDPRAILPFVENEKSAGRRVVMAGGCFELLHVGHMRYLEGARRAGDTLIVGVNTDETVTRLKGPGRPYVPFASRIYLVSQIRYVDAAFGFDSFTMDPVLELLQPDVYAKGTDYSQKKLPEQAPYDGRFTGDVCFTGDPKDHSVTNIIAAIKERYA